MAVPFAFVALFAVAFVTSDAAPPAAQLELLDEQSDPLAVCNDGGRAGYYYRPADTTLPGARRWTVFLEFGMWCWDEFSCHERNRTRPFFMTGGAVGIELADWRSDLDNEIYSDRIAENPVLAGAHAVYVPYCSSDSWSGDRGASDETFGWHFRGKRIVMEVLRQLHRRHGLGAQTETVFLTGTSAGGMGVLANADDVSALLEQLAPGAHFAAEMNAGWFVDIPPADHCQTLPDCPEDDPSAAPTTVGDQVRAGRALWAGRPDAGCMAELGETESWRCYLGATGYKYVETSLMVTQSQTDCWPLAWAGAAPAAQPSKLDNDWCTVDGSSSAPGAQGFARRFRNAIAAELRSVAAPKDALFAPTCYVHNIGWHQMIDVPGTEKNSRLFCSRGEVLGHWLLQQESACGQLLLDNCAGLGCSIGCSPADAFV